MIYTHRYSFLQAWQPQARALTLLVITGVGLALVPGLPTMSYQASLAIAERLAKADPGNAGWQHDLLSLSDGRVAMVAARQGAHDDALGAFRQGREVIGRC